jgi:pimeloyl-ACP methyl ester carboxylesterase
VIVYQARPRPIRDYIRGVVEKASAAAKARGESGTVTVVAHSLGGIAAFDALIEKPDPTVRRLITVGSQVPLLYELDALSTLPLRRDRSGAVIATPHELPNDFPKWLNVYDPRDFLSYRAEPVFGEVSVHDIEVDNALPFPEAHSGYWSNQTVWSSIFDRLKGDSDG